MSRWPLLALVAIAAAAFAFIIARHSNRVGPEPTDLDRLAPPRDPSVLDDQPPAPRCGDGRLDPGEECEPPGETVSCADLLAHAGPEPARCAPDCLWDLAACLPEDATCGNGRLEAGELCDDGNTASGDGCDAGCVVEVGGESVHYDGAAVDLRIARALDGSICLDPNVRAGARSGPVRRVEVRLYICRLPNGEDVYPLARIRAGLAAARRALRPAGIDLAEDGAVHLAFDADCRVPWGAPDLRELAAEARSAHTLPLFFVEAISGGDVPGATPAGFASFGYGAVLGTTAPAVLTHELGHVFGLMHTHACLGDARRDADDCERTGDGLCDTPFDPGPSWLPVTCPGRSPESCPSECADAACSGGARPDRDNVMSYYSGCLARFSADQLDLARCTLDHELSGLRAADRCGSELCNGADDDCDGEVDEAGVCEPDCRAATPLGLGRSAGTTTGRGEAYGGDLYPEGTPDALLELRPAQRDRYCIAIAADSPASRVLGPIVAQRAGCAWNARILASNLDRDARRLRPTLEVSAGPDEPAWLSVDGWGESDGVRYRLDVSSGPCELAGRLRTPHLLAPHDWALTTDDPIALTWDPIGGAEAYELRLGGERDDLTGESPCAHCEAQIVEAPGVALQGVPTGSIVQWTVRALRGDEAGPFARSRTFEVGRRPGEIPLAAPRLSTPEPDALLPTLTESFAWEPVDGALYYEFRLGLDLDTIDDDTCTECLSQRVVAATFEPTPLVLGPDLRYFWTVRAGRQAELGPFATPRRLEVEDWVCTRVGRLRAPDEDTAVSGADGQNDLVATCGGESSAEQVWLVVPAESGPLCIDTEGAEFDTVLSVRRRCERPDTEIACNDDGFGEAGGASRLQVEGEQDRPLFVIVDGYDAGDAGSYWLRVDEGPCR